MVALCLCCVSLGRRVVGWIAKLSTWDVLARFLVPRRPPVKVAVACDTRSHDTRILQSPITRTTIWHGNPRSSLISNFLLPCPIALPMLITARQFSQPCPMSRELKLKTAKSLSYVVLMLFIRTMSTKHRLIEYFQRSEVTQGGGKLSKKIGVWWVQI